MAISTVDEPGSRRTRSGVGDDVPMLELAGRLLPLLRGGEAVAVATAIDVVGSSPQSLGSSMAVAGGGAILGSVSGGCVETAALDGCTSVLAGARPRVERFGFG